MAIPQEVRRSTMYKCIESYLDNWLVLLQICDKFKQNIDDGIQKLVSNIAIERNAEDLAPS